MIWRYPYFRKPPYGGFHKWGYPKRWMLCFKENPIKMDDVELPMVTRILGIPYMSLSGWKAKTSFT